MRAVRMKTAAAAGCHAMAQSLVLERLADLRSRARGLAAAADAQKKQEVRSSFSWFCQSTCLSFSSFLNALGLSLTATWP